MNCQEAQDLLLEADRPALHGEPTTALGRHVTTCPACGSLARRILAGETELDLALAQRSERLPRAGGLARPRARPRMPLAAWGVLAAAALVVLVMLPRQRPPAGQARLVDERDPVAVDVDVSSDAGRTAVVFRTADPKITVVWFFQD